MSHPPVCSFPSSTPFSTQMSDQIHWKRLFSRFIALFCLFLFFLSDGIVLRGSALHVLLQQLKEATDNPGPSWWSFLEHQCPMIPGERHQSQKAKRVRWAHCRDVSTEGESIIQIRRLTMHIDSDNDDIYCFLNSLSFINATLPLIHKKMHIYSRM